MARTAKPKSDVNRNVVSLKVTLRDTKPPVWRRLLVPGETTLGDLHRAIQAAMGWEDYHPALFMLSLRKRVLRVFGLAERLWAAGGGATESVVSTESTTPGSVWRRCGR
jgi:hypothetical protein